MQRQGHAARVVVGVDGSERNLAAVDWAAQEARDRGLALLLVGVASPGSSSAGVWPGDATLQYAEAETAAILGRAAGRVTRADGPATDTLVRIGEPAHELREVSRPDDLVVVGRRGIGLVEQLVLGSTSLDLAGSSIGPLVVVPDGWSAREPGPDAGGSPVVAGIDGTVRDEAVLEHAFERAAREGARLVVVAAAQLPGFYAWESGELDRWAKEAEDRLTEEMVPWARRFPDVALECRAPVRGAAVAILGAARNARIVVLGRYAGPRHVASLSGLSTSRKVLHHARCPVAVVPVQVGDPEELTFDDTDAPQF